MKMIDAEKVLYQLENNKKIHEEKVKDGVEKLNQKLRSDAYSVDSIVANSTLGYRYHDLIDRKDMINSNLKSNLNKGLHQIDVELYRLNKKLDNESRMINYNVDRKKEELLNNIKYKLQ
ncbi:MAG: hypothetical protein BZ137_05380 [Methanosphaera sp. rholeuAM130]|nr:MAG: hypothetical protein BZ137_05380 [Methanosphaera sp. rholeuAM130]